MMALAINNLEKYPYASWMDVNALEKVADFVTMSSVSRQSIQLLW